MTRKHAHGVLAATAFLATGVPAAAEDGSDRRATAFYAHYSPDRMIDILRIRDVDIAGHSRIAGIALAQRIGRSGDSLDWEAEAQLVQHFGRQNHPEFNTLLIARWTRFPWDHYVDTSFAFGWGLSYAFDVPELEPRGGNGDGASQRLLNYLLVEVDAELPWQGWGVVARLHHRSGIFGLYGGIDGGSNYIGGGLRYRW